MAGLILAWLALAGCDPAKPATDSAPRHADADGDGLLAWSDCDDGDPAIGAPRAWALDADVDGFASGETSAWACWAPEGHLAAPGADETDCDDGAPEVHPGAEETCDERDEDCDDAVDEDAVDAVAFYADGDGDGFVDPEVGWAACQAPAGFLPAPLDGGWDCNDGDASVSPDGEDRCGDGADGDCDGAVDEGAPETCDGLDEDCDGAVDEGAPGGDPWYLDADGDGAGDDATEAISCGAPGDGPWVGQGGDCDDDDPWLNPWSAEVCDGIDNDCDGGADEGFDYSDWYLDRDGDSYGDSSAARSYCEQPAGYAALDGDCDDGAASTHPGAIEIWYDGVDADCDGASDYDADADTDDVTPWGGDCDDDDASVWSGADELCDGLDTDCDGIVDEDALDAATWYADEDGDGYGADDDSQIACADADGEGPSGYIADAGDCDDADPDIHPGAEDTLFDGIDSDCDGEDHELELDDAGFKLVGETDGDFAGYDVDGAGDVDGDGYGDLLIGAYNEDSGGSNAGAAYLVLGPTTADLDLASADAKLTGEGAADRAGYSVAGAGDVDGDGYDDLLIGAYAEDDGGTNAGAAYLVLGPVSGALDLASADAKLTGAEDDYAGFSVAGAGDTDGDGGDDLLIAAPYADPDGAEVGVAYLVLGATAVASGTLDLASADAQLIGEAEDDGAGYSTTGLGDTSGDGLDDLSVGAPNEGTEAEDAGAAYLVLGPVSGSLDLADADTKLTGEAEDDHAGYGVGSAGDVDGDGYSDLLVGAWAESSGGSYAGATYLVLGPLSAGTIGLSQADTKLIGEESGDDSGRTMDGGDVDGDGRSDLLLGVGGEDNSTGAAYLLFGPLTAGSLDLSQADAKLAGATRTNFAGIGAAVVRDTDGDGLDDLLVGAHQDDDGGTNAGAAWLLTLDTIGL